MDDKVLLQNIRTWVINNLGPMFEFRQYQLDTVYNIVNKILNNEETQIIEAPTGSGKSLTILISAGILAEFYHKRSYILCSDLLLWQQYADVITDKKLDFGKIKGTFNNYICNQNGQDLSCAICRLKQVSQQKLMDRSWTSANDFECADTCEYVYERRKALKAPVTLMPYQLFCLLPFANDDGNPYTFRRRDVIFCDECHNIPSIVQMMCDPVLELEHDYAKVSEFLKYCKDNNVLELDIDEIELKSIMESAFKELSIVEDGNLTKEDIFKAFDQYTMYSLILFANAVPMVQSDFKKKLEYGHYSLSKEERHINSIMNWLSDYCGTIGTFKMCVLCGHEEKEIKLLTTEEKKKIIKLGSSFLTKTVNTNKDGKVSINMKYAKEDMMSQVFLLQKADYKVLMSATVGQSSSYEDNIGIPFSKSKKADFTRIPSTFDFSKSPIYFIPKYKMTKDMIGENMPKMANLINTIISSQKHQNERGIIHSGSYKNALDLYNMMPGSSKHRIILYSTAKEKEEKLDEYLAKPDAILMGPTLTEGIDLPDDGCRFIIIMKVPFPYLGDELVRAKIQLFPKWYNAEASNNIIQAIGRGNRHMYDWSVSYILDASFKKLYDTTKDQYPIEMQRRINFITTSL